MRENKCKIFNVYVSSLEITVGELKKTAETGFDQEHRDQYLVDFCMSRCANHREQCKNCSLFVLVHSPIDGKYSCTGL